MANYLKIAAGGTLISLMLTGCSFGPRKAFNPADAPSDSGEVFFYRPSEMTARLISPTITANGAKLGRVSNDSYGVAVLPPGEVKLRSTWPGVPGTIRDDAVALNVEAGKKYYLRVRYHVSQAHGLTPSIKGIGGLSFENRVGLEEVPEAEATAQMAGMEPSAGFPSPSK
jgi:hypothetical protein